MKNLNWNELLNKIENKLSKNIDILCKGKEIINTKGLRIIIYLYVHP